MALIAEFTWHVISREQAIKLFVTEAFEVYKLYDDDTEALCDRIEDILEHKGEFGIEIDNTKVVYDEEPDDIINEPEGYVTEWCAHCDQEVRIKSIAKQVQVCPNCGEYIMACCLCDCDNTDCSLCNEQMNLLRKQRQCIAI